MECRPLLSVLHTMRDKQSDVPHLEVLECDLRVLKNDTNQLTIVIYSLLSTTKHTS